MMVALLVAWMASALAGRTVVKLVGVLIRRERCVCDCARGSALLLWLCYTVVVAVAAAMAWWGLCLRRRRCVRVVGCVGGGHGVGRDGGRGVARCDTW